MVIPIRRLSIYVTLVTFLLLTGFDKVQQLQISKVETNILENENILTYDIQLQNTGNKPFKSKFDYPGNRYLGIEVVVKPKRKLAAKMDLVENSKYIKMILIESESTKMIPPKSEGKFHLEYKIKEGSDPNYVKRMAFESTLLILDGVEILKEIPLKSYKYTH